MHLVAGFHVKMQAGFRKVPFFIFRFFILFYMEQILVGDGLPSLELGQFIARGCKSNILKATDIQGISCDLLRIKINLDPSNVYAAKGIHFRETRPATIKSNAELKKDFLSFQKQHKGKCKYLIDFIGFLESKKFENDEIFQFL